MSCPECATYSARGPTPVRAEGLWMCVRSWMPWTERKKSEMPNVEFIYEQTCPFVP